MQVLQLLISGIAQGCIYGLIALGFVLIYKATETVSFAQGELMMLGAFVGLAAMTMLGFPYWLAVLSSIVGMALFGIALERLVIRPILGQPQFTIMMLTIGIGYIVRGVITMIPNIGTETHTLPVPYKDMIWKLGGNAQGVGALSEAKVRMEQVFNSERTYNCALKFDPVFDGTPFSVAVSNCTTTTFTMTATGKSSDGMNGYTYTINQSGEKTSKTPSVSESKSCWLLSKGATAC